MHALKGGLPTLRLRVAFISSIGGCRCPRKSDYTYAHMRAAWCSLRLPSQSFLHPQIASDCRDMPPRTLRIRQLTLAERRRINDVMQVQKGSATDALRSVNKERHKHGIRPLGKWCVHRYATGLTHKLGSVEKRERRPSLAKRDARKLDSTRRRLIRQANGQRRVTYKDIVEAASLGRPVCERVCADALRNQGMAFRTPRTKIYVADEDAKVRLDTAKAWVKRPGKYWSDNVHAYVDNKAFPIPRTQKQRAKYRRTMVTCHLRKASEGVDRGFTKPREKHSFLGMPSAIVSAAVAKDKVIMWHVVSGNWNGTAAAIMYEET